VIKDRRVIGVADKHAAKLPQWRVLQSMPSHGNFRAKAQTPSASLFSNDDGPDNTPGPSWWTVGIRIKTIALPRLPEHFHKCSQATNTR
jgi:hypothetical protein